MNLERADLSGADLRGVQLREANLRHADLSGATLTHSDLQWADLEGANLSFVQLGEAVLLNTNLKGASLLGVDLSRVALEGAVLRGAHYDKATRWPTGVIWGIDPKRQGAILTEGTIGTSGHSITQAPDRRPSGGWEVSGTTPPPMSRRAGVPVWESRPSGSLWQRIVAAMGLCWGRLSWDERWLELEVSGHKDRVDLSAPLSVQLDVWLVDEHRLEATLNVMNKNQRRRLQLKALLFQDEVSASRPVNNTRAPWLRRRDFMRLWALLCWVTQAQGTNLRGWLKPISRR